MVLKPSLYVQHVNGTVHKLMKTWTFTDMCTELKQSNRQFFFVCVFLSLCPPPCSISLRVLLLYESSQEDSSSGPPTSRVQLWKEAAGWVTFTWGITTFWDRYRGERATFWRYRNTHHTNDTVVSLSPNMLNSNQARTKCYDQCQDCCSSLIRTEIIVCLFLMNT